MHTPQLTQTLSRSPSWPLLLLYVWHAACFKARTMRHNTVCLGNSLLLHHSLFLCTSLSVWLFDSHTLFSYSDYTETLKEPLLAQPFHKAPLPFPRISNEQKRWQPHAQKWLIFNFSPLFQVVSERDVSKQEPRGGKDGHKKGEENKSWKNQTGQIFFKQYHYPNRWAL